MDKPFVLFFDCETAPNVSYTWGKYEQDVIAFQKEWHLLSFAYKWQGQSKVSVRGLCDFTEYNKDKTNDLPLVKELWELFHKADIIIAHNADQFDIKKANARFLAHNLGVPSHYRTVDTLKVARKNFSLNSNKLDDLAKVLKLKGKLAHTGFDLWLGCMAGDLKAWKLMKKYNKQDVVLLEQVYTKLLPWIDNHPNRNAWGNLIGCPNCGSENINSNGYRYAQGSKYRRVQCLDCGTWGKQSLIGNPIIKNK